MDLVRQLRDVRFETAVRGYDYAGVDTFLATLRSDVADLQERYEAAQQRIAQFEADGPQDSSDTEGELRRTLVLAQRLADETEADAKATADELVSAATEHAETTRVEAEAAAAEMRAAAEQELAAAHEEAKTLRQGATAGAEQANAEARMRAEELLANAETASAARVVEIEQLAQDEVATMREPIREEIAQLEGVRSRLLGDISDLEAHLEAQRVRVRTAVEALRVGMSGSIQDLERVAEDDALMAPEPAPEHSSVHGDDVAAAPDIEIQESVAAQGAETAPTVDDLATEVAEVDRPQHAAAADEPSVDTAPISVVGEVDVISVDDETLPEVVVDEAEVAPVAEEPSPGVVVDEVEVAPVDAEPSGPVVVEGPSVPEFAAEAMPEVVVEEVDATPFVGGAVGGAVVGAGAAAGAAAYGGDDEEIVDLDATQAMAAVEDLEQSDVVEIDEEPDALFGTDVGADAELVDGADEATEPANVAGAREGFVANFAASLDQLPIDR